MQTFVPIEFQQARDFSKKLNATFEFIKQNIKPLTRCLLYIAGPPMLIGSILAGKLYTGYFDFVMGFSRNQGNPEMMVDYLTSPILWIQIAGAILLMLASFVVIVSVVNNYMLEYEATKSNNITVEAIWERVRNTLPMYFGTTLLYWLLLMAGYILIVLIIAGAGFLSVFLGVIVGIVTVLAFIYMLVALSLIFVVRTWEKTSFFEAVSRCFTLVKDKWWSTFGLLLVASIIQSTIASAFLIPWYINFFISMMHSLEGGPVAEPSFISELINNVFMTLYFIVSFLLYAIPLLALAFQYFNLVELKEAKGLLTKIETIGQTPASQPKDEQY
ncbi:MAG: hypothetical protein HRU69_02570 [Flammeovirgaceae bacterium]|nr:MAG: hypothetical protein HRU69_02570 [Flammeovirgaceae bacterium]